MRFLTITCKPKLTCGLIGIMAIGVLVVGLGLMPRDVAGEHPKIKVAEPMETMPSKPIVAAANIKMHTVQDGETLSAIAQLYGVDVDTLQGANDQLVAEIHQGDQLLILPSKGVLHTAGVGDTFWYIANLYGVSVATILQANGKTTEELSIGEKIFVPGGKKPQAMEGQFPRGDEPVSRSSVERFIWPTVGQLSSPFGYRWGRLHAGIDLANDAGTLVKAARAGRVSYVGWYSGYGNTVVIEHDQGYVTLYGHLRDYFVQNNQYVTSGQGIAHMGSTGDSTGPHLHFEVQKNGVPTNPYNVLP